MAKFEADLSETNTKLKAALDSSVHISKAQFDKEFSIYQQIWVRLVLLRAKTLSLRPLIDQINPSETEQERIERRLTAFSEAFSGFRDAVEENKPFYALIIYKPLCEIVNLCHTESKEYEYKDPGWSKEYWDRSKRNGEGIIAAIDSCCELIRERISSLSVAQ